MFHPLRFSAAVLTGCLIALSPATATERGAAAFEALVELELGQSAYIDDAGFVLEFTKVLEDSRCPINVLCVWSGNARVLLTVSERSDGGPPLSVELDSAINMERTAVLPDGTRIELVGLGPARIAGPSAGINMAGPYRATFRIFALGAAK